MSALVLFSVGKNSHEQSGRNTGALSKCFGGLRRSTAVHRKRKPARACTMCVCLSIVPPYNEFVKTEKNDGKYNKIKVNPSTFFSRETRNFFYLAGDGKKSPVFVLTNSLYGGLPAAHTQTTPTAQTGRRSGFGSLYRAKARKREGSTKELPATNKPTQRLNWEKGNTVMTEMNFIALRTDERKIEASGDLKWTDCINTSSILTRLIQEAGRHCRRFASDLFILWNALERKIEQKTLESGRLLFGFREDGVDCTGHVLHQFRKGETGRILAKYLYRSIWVLDITVGEDNKVKLELFEASKSPVRNPDSELPWD